MNEIELMLELLRSAHGRLVRAASGASRAKDFQDVRQGLLTELSLIGPGRLNQRPLPDAWSAKEVMEHLLAHDLKHQEIETRGLGHYVEHGREHVEQLAQIGRLLENA